MTMTVGTMAMADIAALAGVRRPVVSVWRSRPVVAGEAVPFPDPVAVRDGVEEFAGDQVVAWLERTGRGNNPDARADAAAYVRPPEMSDPSADPVELATAVLCLKVLTDAALGDLDPDEVVDLADEADPDDEYLYSEVESLGEDLIVMARYVDELTDAAYDPIGALARLHDRRRADGPASRLALTPPALALVGEIGAALAVGSATDELTVTDPTGRVDLTAAVMAALGERLDSRVLVPGGAAVARATRREVLIHGWPLTGTSGSEPRLVLARFPNPATPSMSPAEVLAAVDDIGLTLVPGGSAIVLGPAALLCDALVDPDLQRHRDAVLRLGRLRCAVRLPKGLVTGSPRQSLGLWVIGDEPTGVPLQRRRLASADLTDRRLTADVRSDLATDIAAAAGDPQVAREHAFRFARAVGTAAMLADSRALVAPGGRPSAPMVIRPAERVLAVGDLVAALDDPGLQPVGVAGALQVQASDRAIGMPSAPLGDLLTQRRVRLIPGTRLADDLRRDAGTVRLLTVDDLDHPEAGPTARADPIDLEGRHPAARRTEPGDVVFCPSPRPRAMVDRDGLSVVAAPARVLRCATSARALVPEAVAAAINALPDSARDWHAWPIPLVDPADADNLARALRLLEGEERKATRRLKRLRGLTELLVTGTAERAITLTDHAITLTDHAITLTAHAPATAEEGH